jgi:hypothetical protein
MAKPISNILCTLNFQKNQWIQNFSVIETAVHHRQFRLIITMCYTIRYRFPKLLLNPDPDVVLFSVLIFSFICCQKKRHSRLPLTYSQKLSPAFLDVTVTFSCPMFYSTSRYFSKNFCKTKKWNKEMEKIFVQKMLQFSITCHIA